MASHRYWKIGNVIPLDGGAQIELSELQLLDGTTRVDFGSAFTSTVLPVTGALSDLQDASTAAVVSFSNRAGLEFLWDLGSAVEVNNIAIGAASGAAKFPHTLSLFWSDDGVTYTKHRAGDYYVFPGPFTMTRNVAASVRVRSSGAQQAVNTGVTTLMTLPPPWIEIGDLLVASMTTFNAGATAPAGWSLVAQGMGGGLTGGFVEVWTKRADNEADRAGTFSFGNVTQLLLSVLNSGIRAPVSEATAVKGTGTANDTTSALPEATSLGDGRLGWSAVYWALAFTSGGTTPPATYVPAPPWVVQNPTPVTFLRLTTASNLLSSGQKTSGTVTAGATGPNGGWSMASIVFAGPVQIETRTDIGVGRFIGALSRILPPQPPPSQLDIGRPRPLALTRLRRDFVNPMRGAGVGRVKGTTKDKGSPNIPVAERVVLFRQRDCQPVRETISLLGSGVYSFDYIDETEIYFVVSFDHDGVFRAVIADNLVPELMP